MTAVVAFAQTSTRLRKEAEPKRPAASPRKVLGERRGREARDAGRPKAFSSGGPVARRPTRGDFSPAANQLSSGWTGEPEPPPYGAAL